jgi:protein-L-isoaspartate(D-aspartate) O-methyltransferase
VTTDTATDITSRSPQDLRDRMVKTLTEGGSIRTPEIARALATVPREKFAPEATLEQAYAPYDTVTTKRGPDGRSTSTLSAPYLQAEMLDFASLAMGDRVLEVGSGGYNAALIAELVGAKRVVTMDIDPDVTERVARVLYATGYGDVTVVLGDAMTAADDLGLFDVVLVTVGCRDAPWAHLLKPGGRLIVPIRFATVTRCITFTRSADGTHLIGSRPTLCGFVPARGAAGYPDEEVLLADGAVRLSVEGGSLAFDAPELEAALAGPPAEEWTGVLIGASLPFADLNLWVATVEGTTHGQIWRDQNRDTGIKSSGVWYCPILAEPDSFSYLALRKVDPAPDGGTQWEFGVYGHGRHRDELTSRLADHVKVWDRDRRHGPEPTFTLWPADAQVPAPAVGRIFATGSTQLRLSWSL